MTEKKSREEKNLWFDLIDKKEKQVKVSVVITILLELFTMLEIYGNFSHYEDMIINLLLEILGGYIGLLGFTLSGIAIITALFSKENFETMQGNNKINKLFERNVERFFFLTKLIGICILGIVITYAFIFCDKGLVPWYIFLIWSCLLSYLH